MILSRRGLLAGLAAVLLAAGCTTAVPGAAQPVPSPTTQRVVAPESIQFRLVVTDGTGGVTLADKDGKQYMLGPVLLDGTKVQSAKAEVQPESVDWIVTVRLTSEGAVAFSQVTTANVNGQLAIVVNEVVVSAPTIQSPITDGAVQISGAFTRDDALALADHINGRR